MIRSRTLFRGFILFLLILTLMVILFTFGIYRFFARTLFDHLKYELNESALTLVSILEKAPLEANLDEFCKAAAERPTRITIITRSGRVLGDSQADISALNNHGDRPEVVQVLQGSSGYSVRHSASLGYRLMYVAVPLRYDDASLILRTSRSIDSMDRLLTQVIRTLQLLSLVFFVLAIYLATSAGQWIRKPLQHLVQVATRLSAGDLEARAVVGNPREFQTLGNILNTMAERLDWRIKTIRRQRDEYQSVLSGMSEAVIILDASLRILETNSAAERIFLKRRDEMIGHPLLESARNSEIQHFAEMALASEESLREEVTLFQGEGGERELFFQVHGASLPVREEIDQQARAVLVFTDITGIKQSARVRKDFVSNVSHELKTPITSIKGFVETLEDGAEEDPELRRRFLGIIGKQAENMHAIIEDLLQLSRLDEHSLGSSERIVDLVEVTQRALERIVEGSRERNVALESRLEQSLHVLGNPGLLEQAIFNLLDNAVKYSEAQSRVKLSLERRGDLAHIRISDQGLGIPEEDLPRIFERFYRVDKARSRATGGTGLGLAIVKHIVRVHGGEIEVQSRLGEGSVFSMNLPLSDRGATDGPET